MTRSLRYMPAPGTLYEITNRTIQGRLLLRPSRELNAIILGCLGRALTLCPEICLYAFFFASNHFHLIVSALDFGAISRFMNHLDSNVARLAGGLYGWSDKFWASRFHAIPILDDDALVARLRYLLSHGCKEGLVLRPRDWPGVTCLPALLEGRKLEGVWGDYSSLHNRPRSGDRLGDAPSGTGDGPEPEDAFIRYPVPLTPLPCWGELGEEERQAKVRALVEDIEAETREQHARAATKPMGARRILAQHPHGVPKEIKRRKAPACHAASLALWKDFRALYRAFVSAYREASARLRAGDRGVIFPDHCFPPAMAYHGATGPP